MAKKNGTAKIDAPVEEPAAKNSLPLFFEKPMALEKMRHAASGLRETRDLNYARNTNSIALNVLEFLEASKFYPIVFTAADEPIPLAVVGLERENYFLRDDGSWSEGTYIPAYVRQYPFIFFEDTAVDKFFLCIDECAPQFAVDGGEGTTALFNADGTPSPLSNQALEFCSSYYQHHCITKNFTADLVKHKLLQPYASQATLPSGKKISLSDFMMIDENALNALPDEVFLEFRKKGWLAFIYLALASGSNWNRLPALAKPETTN